MKKADCSCEAIHDFFDAFTLADAQRLLRQAVLAAERHRHWRKNAPANLLYFFDRL